MLPEVPAELGVAGMVIPPEEVAAEAALPLPAPPEDVCNGKNRNQKGELVSFVVFWRVAQNANKRKYLILNL